MLSGKWQLSLGKLSKKILLTNLQIYAYIITSHTIIFIVCIEFCKQLKTIEEIACEIPEALLTKLKDQHLEELSQSLTLVWQQFEQTQQQSEQKKVSRNYSPYAVQF